MDFSTGNSGNRLLNAVVKIGPGCQQEGSFCQHLGKEVAPEVYSIIPNGYVMEALQPVKRSPRLLRDIEFTLMTRVWSRPALPISNDVSWKEKLAVFGVHAPGWVINSIPCLVHGDPTVSNVLVREDDLILCDPRPPRDFIPQNKETDMGRIIQSLYGWEVAMYGAKPVDFLMPHFMEDPCYRASAIFWCGAAAARIEYLERSRGNRKHVLEWCSYVRKECNV